MTGIAVAGSALLNPFDVESFGVDGVVSVLVDVVALIWAPPVLTGTPAGPDVVVEPADLEVIVDVDVEGAADVVEGVEDAAELDVSVFGLAVDERVDVTWLTDAAEVEAEDDELDGSPHAIP